MKRAAMKGTAAESGYSLMGVMIFVFVIMLSGLSFFALSAGETRGAIYRQESTEAFYLADAAVERARAKFIENRAWRDGWTDEACGNGHYSICWPPAPSARPHDRSRSSPKCRRPP